MRVDRVRVNCVSGYTQTSLPYRSKSRLDLPLWQRFTLAERGLLCRRFGGVACVAVGFCCAMADRVRHEKPSTAAAMAKFIKQVCHWRAALSKRVA